MNINKNILRQIIQYNMFNNGKFKLKDNTISNYYINLKNISLYPNLLIKITLKIKSLIKYDDYVICGIPMGGLCFANCLSLLTNKPNILMRDTKKDYGKQNILEYDKNINKNIILIEDVINTGKSILKYINILKQHKFNILDIISVFYRGNKQNYSIDKYKIKYLYTINDLINLNSNISIHNTIISKKNIDNSKINKLYELKHKKKSNIIYSYDMFDYNKLINLIELIHNDIIGLKIHNEIINMNINQEILLYEKCKKYNIFLWEDRKFSDITYIVEKQIKKYEKYRDYISICIISGYEKLNIKTNLGLFVIHNMSNKNNLYSPLIYNQILYNLYNNFNKNIAGIITQSKINILPIITPGINLLNKINDKDQCYNNNIHNINNQFFVIGRSITTNKNPENIINFYKNKLYV